MGTVLMLPSIRTWVGHAICYIKKEKCDITLLLVTVTVRVAIVIVINIYENHSYRFNLILLTPRNNKNKKRKHHRELKTGKYLKENAVSWG
jgi:hypothetical protein